MTAVAHMPPAGGAAWTELRERVEAGTLVVTLTGGAIRAHTTLLTKELQNRHGVHVAFNELVADDTVNRGRLDGALGVLLAATERAEAEARAAHVDLRRHPVQALFKVQPYHVTTAERLTLFDLARNNVFSIRDPVRTCESILRGMLRITFLSTVAGRLPAVDVREIVREGADLRHLRGGSFGGISPVTDVSLGEGRRTIMLDPFGQHVEWMLGARDYSSLGEGFVRYFSYYPVLDGPDLKRDLWEQVRRGLDADAARDAAQRAGHASWEAMVDGWSDTPSTEFHRLPEVLRAPLRFRRTGWQALADVLVALGSRPRQHVIIDSLDLLLRPDACLDELGRRFGLGPRDDAAVPAHVRFHPGFRGSPIATVLFERVYREAGVQPPGGPAPLPPERFPDFLLPEIRAAYAIYARALRSPHRLRWDEGVQALAARPVGPALALAAVEPTAVYARAVIDAPAAEREVVTRDLRRAAPSLSRWFDWIDAS